MSDANELIRYRAALFAKMEQQPGALADCIHHLPAEAWHTWRNPDGLTVHQLLAHLRDMEVLAIGPRVRRILAEETPYLEPFASHLWSVTDQPATPPDHLLTELAQARRVLLAEVAHLPVEAWNRTGFHPPSGSRTLQWWVERAYTHLDGHLRELPVARPAPQPHV